MAAAVLLDDPPQDEQTDRLLKSYLVDTLSQVQESSAIVSALINTALTQYQTWAPETVQAKVKVVGVDGLDYMEDILETCLSRCEDLKTLSAEQVTEIANVIKNGAGAKVRVLTENLPSAALEDFAMKEKVNEILTKVLSQPQIIREQAADLAENVRSSLDKDQDGKVTVKDLAENVAEVTKCAAGFVAATYDSVSDKVSSNLKQVLPTSSVEEYILPIAQPYIDTVKTQWERKAELFQVFLPLWGAIQTLQTYVAVYTSNLQSKFEPFSPYLTNLIGNTSVIDLPLELVQILRGATGYMSDKERDSVVRETRALFWALIDISFLLDVLKDERIQQPSQHRNEGVTLVKDAGNEEMEESSI